MIYPPFPSFKKLGAPCLLVLTPCVFSYAFAKESNLNASSQTSNMPDAQVHDTMIVKASKQTQPITNVIVPIIEITKENIENIQANTVTEVLRQLPGVQITNNGGYNQPGRIYVHGGGDVLVLFNGSRLGSATLGYTDISQIPLAGIEKIEYIRGARAAIYGADASDGVINISTKGKTINKNDTKHQDNVDGKLKVTAGSYGYQSYLANVATASSSAWANLTAQYQHAHGYDTAQFGSSDDDGFENRDLIADLGFEMNQNWMARVTAYHHIARTDYDYDETFGDSWDRNLTTSYNITGQVIYTNSFFSSNLTYANSKDESESQRNPSADDAKIVTQRNYLTWRNHFQFSKINGVSFGAEYMNDDVGDSDTLYEVQERDNKAAYLSFTHDGAMFQFESSLRFDNNEQFGDETTWQLGAGWQIADPLRLSFNTGTGFKAPTFNDLYYPGWSNPDLKPEESHNYEVALEGNQLWLDWRLAGFYKQIDNRILCQTNGGCDNDDVEISGLEIVSQFDTGFIEHSISYEYLVPKDQNTGEDAIRIARHDFKWQANYQYQNWQANLSYIYTGKRYDLDEIELEPYNLVNFSAHYSISSNFTIGARIENIFDEDYQTIASYNSPERSFYLNLDYAL